MATTGTPPQTPPTIVYVSPGDDSSHPYSVNSSGTSITTSAAVLAHVLDQILELDEDDDLREFVKKIKIWRIGHLFSLLLILWQLEA